MVLIFTVIEMDILVHKMVNRLANIIYMNAFVTKEDEEKIRYALVVIINEFFKLIILVLLFSLFGKVQYFLFSLAILFMIRTFSGGRHFGSSLQCLIISVIFFVLSCIVFVDYLTIIENITYLFVFISLALITVYSPFPNPKRPIKNKKRRCRLKVISIFFSILIALMLFSINDDKLFCCGATTMLLQSLQLIHK